MKKVLKKSPPKKVASKHDECWGNWEACKKKKTAHMGDAGEAKTAADDVLG